MKNFFSNIIIGHFYDRNELARLWSYKSFQAISRGVVTPAGSNQIILFVTKEKQSSLTQYLDYINDDYLYWEGEDKGANNNRIIDADHNQEQIHLFYRHRHHAPFQYFGLLNLESYLPFENSPYQFIFKITGEAYSQNTFTTEEVQPVYGNKATVKHSLILSRIGQGQFRINLIKLWSGCAISHIYIPEILRASHIKPWKASDNSERLNPYNGLLLTPLYDSLFDRGFISFENNGAILLSTGIKKLSSQLQITEELKLTRVFNSNFEFLEYHRDIVFLK